MMKSFSSIRILVAVFAAALCGAGIATAQYGVQSLEGLDTTDDLRRVPIPPRDRSNDPILVVKGGTLIDGTGAAPITDATLVIQGDRILDVGRNVRVPANAARTVDASGLYIVPGLIDLHVHFTQQRGDDFAKYTDSDSAATIRGVLKLGQLLDGGITAVRDAGTRNDVAFKLKEAVDRQLLDGPRVFWSGKIITSRSGHGDELTGTASGKPQGAGGASELGGGPNVRVATGPWDWRLAVREQIRRHVDWIKIGAPFTKEEIAAAIDEAHMHGIPVMADAFGDYIAWASEAGLDSLEHPLDMSDATFQVMAKNKTGFVPTITAFYNPTVLGYPTAGIPPGGFFYTWSRRFKVSHERSLEAVSKARQAGIKIGAATDIPFENEKRYPSDYFTELGFLKDAGFSDEEVLACATRTGAEILGMDDKLGTLEKGKLADVLIVAENPLTDIQNVRSMRMVIADGRVVRDRLGGSSATED